MSTEERRKWAAYIPPLTRTSIRTIKRMIARPILLAPRDPIALFSNSRFHLIVITTVAYRRKIYRKI